mmetsp:Transcript_37369/g.75403  ORF Transcript_37369/g.75403 Transcript_37369/m.75403 type:complete len:240 (-) Transcript_37369:190-909(-)
MTRARSSSFPYPMTVPAPAGTPAPQLSGPRHQSIGVEAQFCMVRAFGECFGEAGSRSGQIFPCPQQQAHFPAPLLSDPRMPCLQPPQLVQPCSALPNSCMDSELTVATRNVENWKPFPLHAWQRPEPLQVLQVFGILRCRSANCSILCCFSRSCCSNLCCSFSLFSSNCLSSTSRLLRSSSSLALRRISRRSARLRSFSASRSRCCLSISSSSSLLRSASSFARAARHLPLPPMRSILS